MTGLSMFLLYHRQQRTLMTSQGFHSTKSKIAEPTDYGRPERKQPSLHGRKFTPKFLGTLLCEWPIESIGKCFVFYLYPHLNIKSNKSAYIAGICFRMQRALHIKSNKSAYTAGICFKMQSAFQQMVKHQTIDFILKCGYK